ncbi:hypothetical protein MS5N3_04760 [Marinobacter salsuginis]|uniref:Uncharacterized protein n=1 Tax=Marinobacter salsuginis TaxID=418719 RepID=A0A5M3PJK1_9GAMM|nr:hypothetical protein MS5N3_04760 [Marinobacter salsuginis]
MRGEQIVGQGFPVRQGEQLQSVFADGGAILFRRQPEKEPHRLFKPDGIGGAPGYHQSQAFVGAGAFTDGQRITAAM